MSLQATEPEFSRKKAAVMNSPYVLALAPDEFFALRDRLEEVETEADLPEHLRPLFDELHDQIVEAADFTPRLHPRGRGGRFIRVHFLDKSPSLILRPRTVDLNVIRGTVVNEHGESQDVEDTVMTQDVAKIEELQHGEPGEKLVPREVLNDGPAAEHLDLLFQGALGLDAPTWVGKLTADEQDAMRVWASPDGFSALNGALRSGTAKQTEFTQVTEMFGKPPLYETERRSTRTVAEWSRLIDDAMRKAPLTDQTLSLNVYRGIRDALAVFGPDGPKVGQQITDPGYVATTTEMDMARNFAYEKAAWMPDDAPRPMLLEIETPPGVQGAWMAGLYGGGFKEFTLPRGSTFEVTGLRDELGQKPGDLITAVEMKLVLLSDRKGDEGTDMRWAADHAALYSGFEHDGLKVEIMDARQVNHPDATTQSILTLTEVDGVISDGGEAVGAFEHRLQVNDRGELSVYRDFQALDAEYQGRGFFTAFNRHAEQRYREQGVSKIRLGTIQVGGYAWARAGFGFDSDYYGLFGGMAYGADVFQDERFVGAYAAWRLYSERINEPPFRDRGHVSEEAWAAFEARFAKRAQLQAYVDGDEHALDGVFTSPSAIATFGRDQVWTQEIGPYAGQQMWLGKRFMLDSKWNGVKWLKPRPN